MASIYKKSLLFCGFLLGSCVPNQVFQKKMPQEIARVYYQKFTTGDTQIEGGINFIVTFKKVLPDDVLLQKVHFRGQQRPFLKTNDTVFVASFKKEIKPDYVLSGNSTAEYGNKPPQILVSSFKLKDNQAILEYEKGGKTYFYNCKNLEKKAFINLPTIQEKIN